VQYLLVIIQNLGNSTQLNARCKSADAPGIVANLRAWPLFVRWLAMMQVHFYLDYSAELGSELQK
jgi:hypothetical protein